VVTWAFNDHVPAIPRCGTRLVQLGRQSRVMPFGDYNLARAPAVQWFGVSLDGVPPQNEYDVRMGFTHLYLRGNPLHLPVRGRAPVRISPASKHTGFARVVMAAANVESLALT